MLELWRRTLGYERCDYCQKWSRRRRMILTTLKAQVTGETSAEYYLHQTCFPEWVMRDLTSQLQRLYASATIGGSVTNMRRRTVDENVKITFK